MGIQPERSTPWYEIHTVFSCLSLWLKSGNTPRLFLGGCGTADQFHEMLLKIWKESTHASEVLEEALEEGMGEDLVEGSVPNVDVAQLRIDRRRIIAGPVARWKARYVQTRNIAYGDAGRRNTLDIWRRKDLPLDGRAPVLLQVHGGAWVIGNKEQQALPLLGHMAENGWVCVAINYRLSPRATWPDHIVDVKRALAWIKANIADHGGDPDFVAITGGSAGGHLSSLAALTANEPMFQPGFEEADTSVVAAVPFYGVYDFTDRNGVWPPDTQSMFLAPVVMKCDPDERPDLWADASPIDQVHAGAPTFMVIHGDRDVLAPVEDARTFVAALRDVSEQPVYYLELKGAQHAFETFTSVRANATVDAAARFLQAVYDAYLTGPGNVAEPHEVLESVKVRVGAPLAEEAAVATGDDASS